MRILNAQGAGHDVEADRDVASRAKTSMCDRAGRPGYDSVGQSDNANLAQD
jgi:hypothetical protein